MSAQQPPPKEKPKLTKAERRAKQEADRAAKGQSKDGVAQKKGDSQTQSKAVQGQSVSGAIDASFVQFERECSSGVVTSADQQCELLIHTLTQFTKELQIADDKSFAREFESQLKQAITAIAGGHSLPAACGNLIRQLKQYLHSEAVDIRATDTQVRSQLVDWLCEFNAVRLHLAYEACSQIAHDRLHNCNNVMLFCWCPIINQIVLDAHQNTNQGGQGHPSNLHVTIIDTQPLLAGKRSLEELVSRNVPCSYALLSALAYFIKDMSLVLLGADAILANGNLLGRQGAMQVALVAQAHNVPVLVVCPTYKFVDKVIISSSSVLQPAGLNIHSQEIVPAELITGIITELRTLPPSSAPAILRVKQQQL